MKIIKCDFCGREMTDGQEPIVSVSVKMAETFYGNTSENLYEMDACMNCWEKVLDLSKIMTEGKKK